MTKLSTPRVAPVLRWDTSTFTDNAHVSAAYGAFFSIGSVPTDNEAFGVFNLEA
ncbi:hypothetical protein N9O24_00825 [bacterium]|nr:hypothetical protein [bacterium]